MRESVGYSVTINIISIFIVIVFTFLIAIIIYFKSNKFSNIITDAIEKYEGYNDLADMEITSKMSALGYNVRSIICNTQSLPDNCRLIYYPNDSEETVHTDGKLGYCVYICNEGDYYYYKIRTNMMIDIPIINDILDVPIYSNTNRLFDFAEAFSNRSY